MSQPNTIDICDASEMNFGYGRDEEAVNRTTYTSDTEHKLDMRKQFQLYRTRARRNGVSRGSSKCAVKFTTDVSVDNVAGDGEIILPAILEVSLSLPLGISDVERQDLVIRAADFMLNYSGAGSTGLALTQEMEALTDVLKI
jgi:hypothetical protein